MGIENFSVRFDNPSGVFYAGQIVSGHIQFVTTEPYKSDGVFVHYTGSAEVHWTEDSSSGADTVTDYYDASEPYLDLKMCLYSPPDGNLQPYNYSFPFSVQLPMQIPSSFEGSRRDSPGKISYQVNANVHRSGKHKAIMAILPFTVVGIKDLNNLPQLQNPLNLSKQKKFGIILKSKPLTANISINKQAFVSGENIFLSGEINNESNVKIKECRIKLINVVRYYAQGNTREHRDMVSRCVQPGIAKESKISWENVPVLLPPLPPSTLDGCTIITTEYFLDVELVPGGMGMKLKLTFPFIVGTIPFRQPAPPLPGPAENALASNRPPPYDSLFIG